MQENLNIGSPLSITHKAENNIIIEKYCQEDDPNNCSIYGGLYPLYEITDYNLYQIPEEIKDWSQLHFQDSIGLQGICPSGWHLPAPAEWNELIDFLGGESVAGGKMKEAGTLHWIYGNTGADNSSGFSGLPGGYYLNDYNSYSSVGWTANFWSCPPVDTSSAYSWILGWSDVSIGHNISQALDLLSGRCLRDNDQPGFLTISDENLKSISALNLYGDSTHKEIVIINSSSTYTIYISSIYNKNVAFGLNFSPLALAPGDSLHLTVTFNPPSKDLFIDTLFIRSDDQNDTLVILPLMGIFSPDILFIDRTNISCHGYSDGSVTVATSMGIPPYKYQWDDPANTKDSIVRNLKANIYYHITVTDRNGFSSVDSIMLTEPDQLKFTSSNSRALCSDDNNGFINLYPEGGAPPYSYFWSNSQISRDLSDLLPGEYSVTITDNNNCQTSGSINIPVITPFNNEEICLVTIDTETQKNLIIWERTPGKFTLTYNIYRETNIVDVYDLIGSSDFKNPGTFIDEDSDPTKQAYKYKISSVDTCGNESELSSFHTSLHLTINIGLNGSTNLIWSKYEGFNVQTYNIWRGSDLNSMSLIGSVSGSNYSYTDSDPLPGTNVYQVEVVSPYTCNPDNLKATYSSSFSNPAFRYNVSINDLTSSNSIDIYPNPFSESATLKFRNQEGFQYKLYIMDLSGKICQIIDDIYSSEYVLEKRNLKEGFYLIELRGPDIYRGKMIID
jgi:uncharacterized protein (TIGR02145 family)